MIGGDPDYARALDAFHRAVNAAHQTWEDTRDEPWPGWYYMSSRQRAELGIPEPRQPPEPRPRPPHLDPASPDFQVPRYLHPSHYGLEVQAAVDTQNAVIAAAEATITASLDAHFTAWDREAEP